MLWYKRTTAKKNLHPRQEKSGSVYFFGATGFLRLKGPTIMDLQKVDFCHFEGQSNEKYLNYFREYPLRSK